MAIAPRRLARLDSVESRYFIVIYHCLISVVELLLRFIIPSIKLTSYRIYENSGEYYS